MADRPARPVADSERNVLGVFQSWPGVADSRGNVRRGSLLADGCQAPAEAGLQWAATSSDSSRAACLVADTARICLSAAWARRAPARRALSSIGEISARASDVRARMSLASLQEIAAPSPLPETGTLRHELGTNQARAHGQVTRSNLGPGP